MTRGRRLATASGVLVGLTSVAVIIAVFAADQPDLPSPRIAETGSDSTEDHPVATVGDAAPTAEAAFVAAHTAASALPPGAFGAVVPVEMAEGEPVPLPVGVTLYIESGRSPEALTQHVELTRWERVDGVLARAEVFEPLYATAEPGEHIYSWAGDDTMTVVWAATCAGGWCGRQPSGGAADGTARMYHSLDGGRSWSPDGSFDPNWYVAGVQGGEAVVVTQHAGSGTNAYLSYGTYPSGTHLRGGDDRIWWFGYFPGAGYLWTTPGGGPFVGQTDEEMPRLANPIGAIRWSRHVAIDLGKQASLHVAWAPPGDLTGGTDTTYLVRADILGIPDAVFRVPHGAFASPLAHLCDGRALAGWSPDSDGPSPLAALTTIDFDTGVVRPLSAGELTALGISNGLAVARVVVNQGSSCR